MTRYLCIHPGHERKGKPQAVDVTAQVRLEREFLPRASAYLASTEDVIARALAIRTGDPVDRLAAVRRVLTGTTAPIDAPVVLVADRADRVPGLYEMDELRRDDPTIGRLLDRRFDTASRADDVVVLTDEPAASGSGPSIGSSETLTTTQLEQVQRARVLPQGVFQVMELSARIADAPADEDAIAAAIKEAPVVLGTPITERTGPWRVVIECPVPVGDPPTHHRVVFTGTGDHEPADVLGTPAVGWDVALEDAAAADLAPPMPARRSERRLQWIVLGELLVAALIVGLAWASGALAHAVRETPGWFGFAVTLAVAAIAVGLVPLLARSDTDHNANDTFVLRGYYSSRVQLLTTASLASCVIFALAVASAVVPPVLASDAPIPAPIVTFEASNRVVTATVQLDADGLATDDLITVEVRQFSAEEAEGVLVGRITATGDSAGSALVTDAMALDRGARYLTVLVGVGARSLDTCAPTGPIGAGCTVLSVPPLGAGIVRYVPAASNEELIEQTVPGVTPTPAPTSSPLPTISPTTSISPSISSPTATATPTATPTNA